MPPHTQAGDVGDERIGLISPSPNPPTPSIKSAFPTVQSMPLPRTHTRETSNVVTWGIHWKQPALIIAFALWGLAGAVGHHLYYHLLDKTIVSSPETQQWALRFGTAFSVFTITMLRAAVVAAYNQYIWKVFRDKSFSVADLNKIFSLTSDFTGFFSLALFKHGRKVILLACLCWLLPLAGLTPTATLSVVTSHHTETTDQFLPTLNFSSAFWQDVNVNEDVLTKMGSIISEQMEMPQLTAPAPNSSYTIQFYGPSIQCEIANSSEQAVFDQYNMDVFFESQAFTSSTFQKFKDGAPGFPNIEIMEGGDAQFLLLSIFELDRVIEQEQLGVQTANSSIVCSFVNASFEVGIDYLNGVQDVSQLDIEVMNFYTPGASTPVIWESYGVFFGVITEMMLGNISLSESFSDYTKFNGGYRDFAKSLPLFNTGLITCEEIFWWMNPDNHNWEYMEEVTAPSDSFAEYSLCRNRTISLAIQDLANNFTISLLFNPNITVNVSTPVSITTPQNIYQYDSRNLVISYAVGITATIFAVVVGLMAIHSNGVCHSTSFSAIMTSTSGNHQIGELSKGQSLGAEPLSKTVAEKKLRLGVIKVAEDRAEKDEWGDPINRVGFGLEGTVMKLMKGVKSL